MNQEMIQFIMQRMAEWLDNRQMIVLQNTLDESMKMAENRQKMKSSQKVYRITNESNPGSIEKAAFLQYNTFVGITSAGI